MEGPQDHGVANSDASSLLGGWSFRKDNLSRSLSHFVSLWDGDPTSIDRRNPEAPEIFFYQRRLTALIMGQVNVVEDLLFSQAAGNGFTARCLPSMDRDVGSPAQVRGAWFGGLCFHSRRTPCGGWLAPSCTPPLMMAFRFFQWGCLRGSACLPSSGSDGEQLVQDVVDPAGLRHCSVYPGRHDLLSFSLHELSPASLGGLGFLGSGHGFRVGPYADCLQVHPSAPIRYGFLIPEGWCIV